MQNPGFKFEYYAKAIKYNGFNIETYVIGTGEKVVLSLPSFPHSGLYYLWFLNHYNLTKVKFITLDLPGWIGLSENIFKDKEFSLNEYVKVIKEVVKAHELKKFNLLGYSFGAALGVRLASELPEMVNKVCLVSPVIECTSIQNTREVKAVNLLQRFGCGPLIKLYLNRAWRAYKPTLIKEGMPASFISIYDAMLKQADAKVIFDSIYTLFHTDWSVYLSVLETKSLLIVNSKQEGKMFRKQAELLRRRFGGKSAFYQGGHSDFILNPKSEVVKEVVQFLAS